MQYLCKSGRACGKYISQHQRYIAQKHPRTHVWLTYSRYAIFGADENRRIDMNHSLKSQSLAPQGFVFPLYIERLNDRYKPWPSSLSHHINPELMMSRFWEKVNRAGSPTPMPIQTIIHEILPTLGKKYRARDNDTFFDGKHYRSRDICLISTIVQWFATNSGNGFLEKINCYWLDLYTDRKDYYQVKYSAEQKLSDMFRYWTHVCMPCCYNPSRFTADSDRHVLSTQSVTARDRAIAQAVMKWLDSDAGNAFRIAWSERMKKATDILHSKRAWEIQLKLLDLRIVKYGSLKKVA